MPASSTPPKSVLVYSAGETIGDGLFKIPFLKQLRARFPDARITWLAGIGPTTYATTLAPAVGGLLDEVIPQGGVGTTARHLLPFQRPLPDRRFDLIVDTQRSVFRTMVVRRIRHGRFVAGTADFLLSDVRPAKGTKLPRPLLERLAALLDLVSDPPAAPPPAGLAVDPAFREVAAAALPDGPTYVGISPGAGDKAKVWPLDRFVEVARAQLAAGRVPVFLVGPDEQEWLPTLRADVPEALFPEWDRHDGRPEVKGPVLVIALAERLAAAVANDSGTGHMLAAGGTPLVSLFSKHDPAKYAPHAARLEIIDSKDHGGTDPSLIPTDLVLAALDRFLP
jgi:ADP-heptose:LPS heptosyltransferase